MVAEDAGYYSVRGAGGAAWLAGTGRLLDAATSKLAVVSEGGVKRRRRRRPEEAEAEILASAERLLRTRALHELTVEEIMRGTTLSRKSFYVYFPDRYQLLERLFEGVRKRLDEVNRQVLDGADFLVASRAALMAVAEVARDAGRPMRALFEASAHDPRAGRLWRRFTDPVARGLATKIRQGTDAGVISGVRDPDAVARALVGMDHFALFDRIIGHPRADVEAIVDGVHEVWVRTLTLQPLPPRAK